MVVARQAQQLRQMRAEADSAPSSPQAIERKRPANLAADLPAHPNHFPTAPPEPRETSRGAFDWKQIESEDYQEYVVNLRNLGVPEETIRAIVVSELRHSFAEDRQTLLREYLGTNYWETPEPESLAELALRKRELNEEMSNRLRSLFGEDAPHVDHNAVWRAAELSHRLAFLPEEKRARATEILLRHQEAEARTKELADGRGTDDDAPAHLQALEDQERKQSLLWEMLTPSEFEEVELRTSWTAENLRRGMANFHPTEDEFRAVFRAWRAHDEELALVYATAQPDPGNEHVFEQIQEALGDDRYGQYREAWWK